MANFRTEDGIVHMQGMPEGPVTRLDVTCCGTHVVTEPDAVTVLVARTNPHVTVVETEATCIQCLGE